MDGKNIALKPQIFIIPIEQYEDDIDPKRSKEEKNEIQRN